MDKPKLPVLPEPGSQEEEFLKHRYRFAGAEYDRKQHQVFSELAAFKRWHFNQSKPRGC